MSKDINYFRNKLEKERDSFLNKMKLAEGMQKHESLKDSTQELSLYDNHPADLASENFERSKDLALHSKELQQYEHVKKALEKIDMGGFGTCEGCGTRIDPARLEEVPETRYCLRCKEMEERRVEVRSRPLEEEVLSPPFSRSFKDNADYVAYDGEDAWQDVAKFNKLPHVYYEDVEEDDETIGNVEDTDNLSNEDYRKQLE